jgi:hypothetical protein
MEDQHASQNINPPGCSNFCHRHDSKYDLGQVFDNLQTLVTKCVQQQEFRLQQGRALQALQDQIEASTKINNSGLEKLEKQDTH